ncbi:unnamed protein product [Linum trigynum]|uniref:RPW8 domain-containing protein n=1 Tax=Linum trigynum TaxID=586398 RepID=A0AAV2E3L5_9ROSI
MPSFLQSTVPASAGAGLNILFEHVLVAIFNVSKNNSIFDSTFQRLEQTLRSMGPAISKIDAYNMDFDRPKEIDGLKIILKKGAQLITKSAKIKCYDVVRRLMYSRKLLKLEDKLTRYSTSRLQLHQVADGKEILYEVKQLSYQVWEMRMEAAGSYGSTGGSGKTTFATAFCDDQEVKDMIQKFTLCFRWDGEMIRSTKGIDYQDDEKMDMMFEFLKENRGIKVVEVYVEFEDVDKWGGYPFLGGYYGSSVDSSNQHGRSMGSSNQYDSGVGSSHQYDNCAETHSGYNYKPQTSLRVYAGYNYIPQPTGYGSGRVASPVMSTCSTLPMSCIENEELVRGEYGDPSCPRSGPPNYSSEDDFEDDEDELKMISIDDPIRDEGENIPSTPHYKMLLPHLVCDQNDNSENPPTPLWDLSTLFQVNTTFPGKKEYMALKREAMGRNFEFSVYRSSKIKLHVQCKKIDEGYSWNVRVAVLGDMDFWVIHKVQNNHTWSSGTLVQDRLLLYSNFVADNIKHLEKVQPNITIKAIQAEIQTHLSFTIKYKKTSHGKQKVIEEVYGDWLESYTYLSLLTEAIEHCNLRFPHYLIIIQVDGTFLTDKYKRCFIIAGGVDKKNQIFPLVLDVVEGEKKRRCEWLFLQLHKYVIQHEDLVISNGHNGISHSKHVIGSKIPWKGQWFLRHFINNCGERWSRKYIKQRLWWPVRCLGYYLDNIMIIWTTVTKAANLLTIWHNIFQRFGRQVPVFHREEDAVNKLEYLLKDMDGKPTDKMQALSDVDAMDLFRQSAFLHEGNSYEPDQEVPEKIVKRCKVFPLLISVVGKSLLKNPMVERHKRAKECSKTASFLENSEVLDCLQKSVDPLDNKQPIKECHMDLGLFPNHRKILVAALIDMWVELHGLDEDYVISNLYELTLFQKSS